MKHEHTALEQAAIQVAEAYAQANGYPRLTGAGLVLIGMVLAAGCDTDTAAQLREGWLAQHPDARDALDGWSTYLDAAAR